MQINVQQRHTQRQYMCMISTIILSSHTCGFHETLTNSQTGPVSMGSTCCVCVSVVQTNRVWSWTASSNNQSLWHKQIKQRLCRSSGSEHPCILRVHLASTLDGLYYYGVKQFKQLSEHEGKIWWGQTCFMLSSAQRCYRDRPTFSFFLFFVGSVAPRGQQIEMVQWRWQGIWSSKLLEGQEAILFPISEGRVFSCLVW